MDVVFIGTPVGLRNIVVELATLDEALGTKDVN